MLVGPRTIVARGAGCGVLRKLSGRCATTICLCARGHPRLGGVHHLTRGRRYAVGLTNDSVWLKTGPGLLTFAVRTKNLGGGRGPPRERRLPAPQGALRVHSGRMCRCPYKARARLWNKTRAGDWNGASNCLTVRADRLRAPNPLGFDLGSELTRLGEIRPITLVRDLRARTTVNPATGSAREIVSLARTSRYGIGWFW